MAPDELIAHLRENSTAASDIIDLAQYSALPLYIDEELHSGREGDDVDLAGDTDVRLNLDLSVTDVSSTSQDDKVNGLPAR